ncbi:hypothetical protein EDD18DRAFT_1360052 [Armillaria luteobubalina]|uniref:ATP-dependent DNA helicase n=1 Tax=Armillaria luteobubalina TaxID=153913 RepID=A0AA39PPF6_9AGAR|nr:hypothetical protein EDD18DRAFT_1360052 [Armillaria luteobubalina]
MRNFNLKYECLDKRNNYHAQLRSGAITVPSWDEAAAANVDFLRLDYSPTTTDGIEECAKQSAFLDERGLFIDMTQASKMADIRWVLDLAGWTTERPINRPSVMDPITTVRGRGEWNAIIKRKRQEMIDDRLRNITSTKDKQKGNNNPESDKVQIVDKNWLERCFHDKKYKASLDEVAVLFSLNKEQAHAFRLVANHSTSPYNDQLKMYIAGMGGTGKSQVLKALIKFFEMQKEEHRIIIVAPTGSAAALLGGSTYHSVFGINSQQHMKADLAQV